MPVGSVLYNNLFDFIFSIIDITFIETYPIILAGIYNITYYLLDDIIFIKVEKSIHILSFVIEKSSLIVE